MKIFWRAMARSSVEPIWLKRWDIAPWLHSVRLAGGQVEVALFTLPNRRGVFALGLDVARWLADAYQTNFVSSHALRQPL